MNYTKRNFYTKCNFYHNTTVSVCGSREFAVVADAD